MQTPPSSPGFAHFVAQSDAVGLALFGILAAMSIVAWTLIALKGITHLTRRRRGDRFLSGFWNARSIEQANDGIRDQGAGDPFSHLAAEAIRARAHHARHGSERLADAGSAQEFVTRTLRKVLDEENTRMENGLTTLATIGATAPFVGLFGTVWGIYHALIAIGTSGTASLDRIAGPVGEALVMTALGLAVAVPAVVAYNAFGRANRVLNARLDAFAFELLTFLSLGRALHGADGETPTTADAPARLRAVQGA
jgi:biopolymer transport protein ExbB